MMTWRVLAIVGWYAVCYDTTADVDDAAPLLAVGGGDGKVDAYK